MNDLFEMWYEDWKKGKQPYIRQFENYIKILAGFWPDSCEQYGVCGIQNVVEADGSVYPCDFYVLDDFCLGNVNESNYVRMQQRRKEIGFVERSMNSSAECSECRWFFLCKDGCYRSREEGKNYFCKAYRMFFEKNYERLLEIVE